MKPLSLVLIVAATTALEAAPIPIANLERKEPVEFSREVYPLLKQSCLACHNATKAKANLNLESPDLMLKGGDGGPAIVPGKSGESLLLKSAAHQDDDLLMPPPGNKANAVALTPEELGLVKLWIDQGAKGSAVAEAKGPLPWRAVPKPGPVQAAAISPDGRLAAVARGNRVALSELATGQTLTELGDPELANLGPWKDQRVADSDGVMSVAFGGEDLLATGGFRTVRLWRRIPRTVQRDLGTLPEGSALLAVSGDGRWAAAADGKGGVYLWPLDAEKFEPVPLSKEGPAISALCFSPNGQALIAATADKQIRVWGVSERTVVLEGPLPVAVHSVALTPAGELLAGCGDGVLRVWKWPEARPESLPTPVRELKLQDQPITALAASSPEEFVWIAADGTLRFADLRDGKERRKVEIEHPLGRRLAALEGELQVAQRLAATRKSQLAAAGDDATKKTEAARQAALNFEKAKTDLRRKQDDAKVASEAFAAAPADKSLEGAAKKANDIAAGAEAAMRAAKVNAELGSRQAAEAAANRAASEVAVAAADASAAEIQALVDGVKQQIAASLPPARQLAVTSDGSIAVLDANGALRHISPAAGTLLEPVDQVGAFAVTPGGSLLVASADKRVKLTTARRAWTLERVIGNSEDPAQLADRVMAVAFSPDGRLLATGGGVPSRDGELKLWRVADGALVRQIAKAHADSINGLAFSPDGELLATAAGDRFARVWKTSDGTRVANLEGHTGHVLSVAWRADGLAIATGGADRSVRLWDSASFKQTKVINNFTAEVAAVSFVGGTDQLLIASGDRSLRMGDQPLPDSATFPFCATSDPVGKVVAAGGEDGVLRIWNVADRKLARSLSPGAN